MPDLAERHWTAADVRKLPDDGNRYECIDGALLVTPSPRPPHQLALVELYDALSGYIRGNGIGRLMWSPADIEVVPGTLVQPDLYVPRHRAGETRIRDWPDVVGLRLAVEVVSASTARYDRIVKRRFYQRAGVEEYWIVDLDARLVERWRPGDASPEILTERLAWSPAGAVEPFELDLTAYFAVVLDG
ncbi:MAG: Uma2 family endonuclease [Gemmatimonadaceae bacterium]